jgi:hypothetical protein
MPFVLDERVDSDLLADESAAQALLGRLDAAMQVAGRQEGSERGVLSYLEVESS